jgi:DNA-binding SARP family transcriptional activator
LGGFEIFHGKNQQDLPKSRKTRALLAYLILSGRRHRRERLCDLFWDIPDDPKASLRWSLSKLRSLVDTPGCERLIADREYVFFDPKETAIDVFEIRRELAGGANALSTKRLLNLAEQFRGDLLEGLTIPDHQDFEAWLLTERETAKRTRASLLHVLVNRLQADARTDTVVYARDLVAADRFSVSAHAMLIRALSVAGHLQEAERQH